MENDLRITERDLIKHLGSPIHKSYDDGWCVPQFYWHQKFIIPVSLPYFGPVAVHRVIARNLQELCGIWARPSRRLINHCNALDIKLPDLSAFRVKDAVGFATRRKMCNPKRELSWHAFGLAIDINPTENRFGTKGSMPEELVQLFKALGWDWGGDWQGEPDPMHFQPSIKWMLDILAKKGNDSEA